MALLTRKQDSLQNDVMNLLDQLRKLTDNSKNNLVSPEEIRMRFRSLKEKFICFIQSGEEVPDESDPVFNENDPSVEIPKLKMFSFRSKKEENANVKIINRPISIRNDIEFPGIKEQVKLGIKEVKIGESLNYEKSNEIKSKPNECTNIKNRALSTVKEHRTDKHQKQDWANCELKIERAAFGTEICMGQLYDIKTETSNSQDLFSESSYYPYTEVENVYKYETRISENDRLSSKFKLFDIQPEQQLSIILNPSSIDDESYGKYLLENFQNTVSKTLFYKYTTVVEKLFAPFDELQPHMNTDIFEQFRSNYVVVGIIWGIIRTLTLEHHSTESNRSEMINLLDKEMDSLNTYLTSKVDEEYKCSNPDFCKSLILTVDGDIIVPLGNGAVQLKNEIEYISKVPQIFNGRIGVPLKYVMIPLSSFFRRSSFVVALQLVDIDFIKSCVDFFDKIADMNKNLYDLNDIAMKNSNDVLINEIKNCRQNIDEMAAELKLTILELRSGELKVDDIREILRKYERRRIGYKEMIEVTISVHSEEV